MSAAPGVPVALVDLDDAQLMARVQRGDDDAFGALYDRFGSRALGVARTIGRPPHAEDIVQEAFLAVWRNRASFHPDRGTAVAWVLGVVRNRAIDSLRRQGRHDERLADAEGMEELLHAAGNLETRVVERDQAARLRRDVAALPSAQRDVLALAYFGELSTAEIAAQLLLPLGTVKGRMRLGLEKLRAADRS